MPALLGGRRRATEPRNPFLPADPSAPAPSLEVLDADELLGRAVVFDGPPQPLGIPADPTDAHRLPRRVVTDDPLLWIVGLHGGAGASTVTTLLGDDVQDAGRCWPTSTDQVNRDQRDDQPGAAAPRALAIARTHAAGLDAAAAAARAWSAGDLPGPQLLGIVLVDDAPKLPRPLLAEAKRVMAMYPHGWHFAWREALRLRATPSAEGVPVRLNVTLGDIRRRALLARRPEGTSA